MRLNVASITCLAAAALVGCAHVAEFSVMRPAMFNVAPLGNTISVGQIGDPRGGAAAADVSADLSGRIANSLNPSIRLAAGGNGGVVITGFVVSDDYGENIHVQRNTCTRQVSTGTNAQGMTTYTNVPYDCSQIHRTGDAIERIQLTLVNAATGLAIYTRMYERHAQRDTSTSYGSGDPPYIDGGAILHGLRAEIVAQFARLILPWQEVVHVRFETCDGDARCNQAFQLIQHSNLQQAETLFTAVIGGDANVPPTAPSGVRTRVSEALYNRGMTRAYLGNFGGAMEDLTRAIAMKPDRTRWQHEMVNVQELAQESIALQQQQAQPAPPPTMPPPAAPGAPAMPPPGAQGGAPAMPPPGAQPPAHPPPAQQQAQPPPAR